MVNEAKHVGGATQGGGGFLINEYRHVLVPTQKGDTLYAGNYSIDLEFVFEGSVISPVAPPGIRPGTVWPGPHPGIRYTLTAGASDIRYEVTTARGTIKQVLLSDFHGRQAISPLLNACRALKAAGGAIYVNEAGEVFAPVDSGTGYERLYITHLGRHPWFPDPS